jgi:NAD(P)H-quinone oxidoreductase subunit 5
VSLLGRHFGEFAEKVLSANQETEMSFAATVFVSVLALWGIGCLPSHLADRYCRWVRRLAVAFAAAQSLIATGGLAWLLTEKRNPIPFECVNWYGLSIGIYYDRVSAVMFFLVSLIGAIVIKYSLRYLDGEGTQGRFLRWLCFTLAAVCTMTLASNLAMFFLAWVCTSWGLHKLLTYYPNRRKARQAALKKFLISRLGDVFLLVSLILIYRVFNTLEFYELFRLANNLKGQATNLGELNFAAIFLVLGGVTKSAQFPFHTWLPETMESPTPVSAFMHAGIINAGGYLMIRLSPLIDPFPVALHLLVVFGAITAALGGVVMLTQTSIKRSLAFSTIAQMGMMMLQCGLGSYSTAMLHIVAHALYKSYAFLNSGSIGQGDQVAFSGRTQRLITQRGFVEPLGVGLLAMVAGIVLWQVSPANDSVSASKVLLWFIFGLAITPVVARLAIDAKRPLLAIATGVGLVAIYFTLSLAMELYLAQVVPGKSPYSPAVTYTVAAFVAFLFLALWGTQMAIDFAPVSTLGRWFYVQASNEFYCDILAHKVIAWNNKRSES